MACLRLFFPAPWSSPQAACPPAQVDGKTRTDPTFPSGFMGAHPPRAVLHAPQRGARSHRFGLVLPLGLQMWCRSTKPMNTFGCCTTPRGGLRFTASRRRRPRYAQSRPSTIAGAPKLGRGGGSCGCGWAANGFAAGSGRQLRAGGQLRLFLGELFGRRNDERRSSPHLVKGTISAWKTKEHA